jgi:hypothetical protein
MGKEIGVFENSLKLLYLFRNSTHKLNKMKILYSFVLVITFSVVFSNNTLAQENTETEETSPFSTGVDIYSSYLWRGSRLGTSPALQPYIEFAKGGLTIGAWGSFDAAAYAETDVYIKYDFTFGLSLGVTDYYLCDLEYFDYSISTGSHAFDINLGYEIKGFSLSANYIMNEAGGIESYGNDLYFEAGYAFKNLNLFLGAGDGWHTTHGGFNVCNIGIGTEKEIRITDHFSIPVSGQVVLNPDSESLYITVGLSL